MAKLVDLIGVRWGRKLFSLVLNDVDNAVEGHGREAQPSGDVDPINTGLAKLHSAEFNNDTAIRSDRSVDNKVSENSGDRRALYKRHLLFLIECDFSDDFHPSSDQLELIEWLAEDIRESRSKHTNPFVANLSFQNQASVFGQPLSDQWKQQRHLYGHNTNTHRGIF